MAAHRLRVAFHGTDRCGRHVVMISHEYRDHDRPGVVQSVTQKFINCNSPEEAASKARRFKMTGRVDLVKEL
jgi:hypothetical protein